MIFSKIIKQNPNQYLEVNAHLSKLMDNRKPALESQLGSDNLGDVEATDYAIEEVLREDEPGYEAASDLDQALMNLII